MSNNFTSVVLFSEVDIMLNNNYIKKTSSFRSNRLFLSCFDNCYAASSEVESGIDVFLWSLCLATLLLH